jgi:CSLREA domain-containing protein
VDNKVQVESFAKADMRCKSALFFWRTVGAGFFTILIIGMFFLSSEALAATFTVNSTNDTVDASLGNGVCADSAGDCSLRAAVMEANADPGTADVITISAGTYTLTLTGNNEDNSETGDLDILGPVTITGANGDREGDASTVIIEGWTNNTYSTDRIFDINPGLVDAGFAVSIEALTIRHGKESNHFGSGYGGGGIGADTGTNTLNLHNIIVKDNVTENGAYGGGIYVSGVDTGTLNITKSIIQNNTSADRGGGLYIEGDIDVFITDSAIDNNTVNYTGTGGYGYGAGMATMPTSSVAGSINFMNSTISNNNGYKTHGGGLFLQIPTSLTNTTISGNSATYGGGGIYASYAVGDVILKNVTIHNNLGNNPNSGGGLYVELGAPILHNTIVSGNTAGGSNSDVILDPDGTPGIHASSSYNLIGITNEDGLVHEVNGNLVGITDPGLLPLASNAGITATHALKSSSAALDAGDNTHAAGVDQRGLERLADAADESTVQTIDIGAFEAHPVVEDIQDQKILTNDSLQVGFRIGDINLGIDQITAVSSNTSYIPNGNLVISGTGHERTLTITPVQGSESVTTITVEIRSNVGTVGNPIYVTMTDTFRIIPSPDLVISLSHTGDFQKGTVETYTVEVENQGIGPSSGLINITHSIPAGLTLTNVSSSSFWTCTLISCYSNDVILPNSVPVPITLTVSVAEGASTGSVDTSVAVSGGGDENVSNNTAIDPTYIYGAPSITFGTNGSELWSSSASSTVTVVDDGGGLDTLTYQWTQDTTTPTNGWTTFVNGDSISKSAAEGDWYLHIKVIDGYADEFNFVTQRFRLDNTVPELTVGMMSDSTAYTSNTWTGADVAITLTSSDSASGIASTEYSTDSGNTWSSYTSVITISSEGTTTVEVRATDNAGLETVQTVIIKVDKTAPTLSAGMTADGAAYTDDTWTGKDVTVTLTSSDTGSGLTSTEYALNNGEWTAYAEPIVITAEQSNTLQIRAVDAAGNETTDTLTIKVDKTDPSLTVGMTSSGEVYISDTWTNADVTITLTSTDAASDIVSTEYSTDSGNTWTAYTNAVTISSEGTTTVNVKATDNAGLVTTDTLTVKLDKTAPILSAEMVAGGAAYTEDTWTGEDVTVTLTSLDGGSGLTNTEYALNNGGWTAYTVPIVITAEQSNTLEIRAIDAAGNETTDTLTIKIDKVAPSLTVDMGDYISDTWTNEAVTVTLATYDTSSQVESTEYSIDDGIFEAYAGAFKISKEGSTKVDVKIVDNSGLETTQTIIIKIDKTAPTLSAAMTTGISTPYNADTWTDEDVTVSLTSSDEVNGSGWSSTEYNLNDAGWIAYENDLVITTEQSNTLEIRATDNAGNETTKISYNVKIDKQGPDLTWALITSNGQFYTEDTWTNQTVTANVYAADNGVGLDLVEYSLNGTDWNIYPISDGIVFKTEGTHIITVKARDHLGNEKIDTKTIKIGLTGPVIQLENDPAGLTNGDVSVRIDVTQGNNPLEALKWAKDARESNYFEQDGNIISIDQRSFLVNDNGIYTVFARDKAGNTVTEVTYVDNIIRILPTLELSAAPTEYTNGSVVVSVTADVNGTAQGNELVSLKWLEGNQTTDDFSFSGNDIELTGEAARTFSVSSNGVYTVYARDTASNEIVKTINVLNINNVSPTLVLSRMPDYPTNEDVTVSVTASVYGENNAIAVIKWAEDNRDALYFSGGQGNVISDDPYQFIVSTNGTYTVYVADALGNEKVQTVGIHNIFKTAPRIELSHSPTATTTGDVTVHVDAQFVGTGNSIEVIKWDKGPQSLSYFKDKGASLLVSSSPITFTVSSNGSYSVYVKDAAGNETVESIVINNIRGTIPDGPSGPSIPNVPENKKVIQNKNGAYVVELSGTQGGSTDIPVEELQAIFNESKNEVIRIGNQNIWYNLPLSELFEAASNPKGIKQVKVQIELVEGDKEQEIRNNIFSGNGLQPLYILQSNVFFIDQEGVSTSVEQFNSYVTRGLKVKGNLSSRNLVVLWYDDASQLWRPIPSYVEKDSDGSIITFRRNGNSQYAVVEANQKTFDDIRNHWAKNDIELLATKQLISGVSDEQFTPNRTITRAEFAAMLVRALGISAKDETAFSDIHSSQWYAHAVGTAKTYGLISGYEDGTFRPDEFISRQEIAVMMQNAIEFATKEKAAQAEQASIFDDQQEIADWAQSAVSNLVQQNIIYGKTAETFAPKQNATRAEAAVMLKRTLTTLGFISE